MGILPRFPSKGLQKCLHLHDFVRHRPDSRRGREVERTLHEITCTGPKLFRAFPTLKGGRLDYAPVSSVAGNYEQTARVTTQLQSSTMNRFCDDRSVLIDLQILHRRPVVPVTNCEQVLTVYFLCLKNPVHIHDLMWWKCWIA